VSREPFTKRPEWLLARGLPVRRSKRPRKRRARVSAKSDWKARYQTRMVYAAKVSAKIKGIAFDLTPSDIPVPDLCPVFGTPLRPNFGGKHPRGDAPSLDRIFSSEGYVRWNVRVISWRANRLKSTLDSTELLRLGEWLKKEETTARRRRWWYERKPRGVVNWEEQR
jgi:hypothetical protein